MNNQPSFWNKYPLTSVTKFVKSSPLGTNLKQLGNFESAHLAFAKILSLFWQICNAIGQIFIGLNSQIFKKIS